jgi:galactitol-specific phosphotransferase system IIB component
MKKVFNIIFLILFLSTTGCGFTPILVKSNYSFSYIIEKSTGSERVNSNIVEKLKTLNGNEKKYNIVLNSKETKNILSKDSKGDPSILEIIINLNYIIKDNGKIIVTKNLNQRSTYNNISDNFEMEKSEEILVENLTKDLAKDIISSTSAISNDN